MRSINFSLPARDGLRDELAGAADGAVGRVDPFSGRIHIPGDRDQSRLGELVVQGGELLLGRFDPRGGHVDQLLGEAVETFRSVDDKIAQLVESLVCVSSSRLAGRGHHHAGPQVSALGGVSGIASSSC